MILSGIEIEKRIGTDIIIEPFSKQYLNPNSYNFRLANQLIMYTEPTLDMKKNNPYREIEIPSDGLKLETNKLYLGRTVEYTETYNLVPMLEGRSSIGRLGLFIHVTAGFGDVGFKGYWTLEILATQPIRIYPYTEICQIYYHTIQGNHKEYNSNKYQNNGGIQPSLLFQEFNSSHSSDG